MDPHAAAIIREIVRRESRSLLAYVRDSFPWTDHDDRTDLGQLQKMIEEERQALERLADILNRHHVSPTYLGGFPSQFTTINYVSLDFLVPQLIAEEQNSIASLARESSEFQGDGHDELAHLLEVKRRHLQGLQAMLKTHTSASLSVA
jgi:hypothetical protein